MDKNVENFFQNVENETRELKNDFFNKLLKKQTEIFDEIGDDLQCKINEISQDSVNSLKTEVEEYIKLKDKISIDVEETNKAIIAGFNDVKQSFNNSLEEHDLSQKQLFNDEKKKLEEIQDTLTKNIESVNAAKDSILAATKTVTSLSKKNNNKIFYISLVLNIVTIVLVTVSFFI